MSEENGTKVPLSRPDDENVAPVSEGKGKGKAVAVRDEEEETVPVVDDDEMDDEEEEESGVEDTEVVSEALLFMALVIGYLFAWTLC